MIDKTLLIFGDSWPYGHELKKHEKPFGKLLAEKWNIGQYINLSIPATSNDRMIIELNDYLNNNQLTTDTVAVFFITDRNRTLVIDYLKNIKDIRVPAQDRETTDMVIKSYYSYIHTIPQETFNLHKNILSLQKICDFNGIKDYYIFGWGELNIDFNGIDKTKIYPQTCSDMFGCTETSREFTIADKQNKYIYPNEWHPNQLGHELIADKLYDWISMNG
jgi:hypothetical protein